MIAKRPPDESNESVNLIVSLLVRHPELSRVIIEPRFSGIKFFFIVREALPLSEQRQFREAILEHLRTFHDLERDGALRIAVHLRTDESLTFVEIVRDARSLGRDEIQLIVSLVVRAFGDRLIVNPPAEEGGDDEFGYNEDEVGSALDAVRRGNQRKGLVGFREERRVLVYFGGK